MKTADRQVIDVTPETEPPPPPAPRSLAIKVLGVASVLMLVGVAAALYFAWQHWQGARAEFASFNERTQEAHRAQQTLLNTIENTRATLSAQQQALEKQQEILDSQATKIQEQETSIRTSQQRLRSERQDLTRARTQLDEKLTRTSRRIEGHPARWLDAEAASLLRTAANNLELGRDRDTTLEGLKRADGLLQQVGESRNGVRQILAQEITAVEAYRPADTQQIAKALRDVQRQTRQLPLKAAVLPAPQAGSPQAAPSPARPDNTATNPWQRAADRSLRQLRTLVTVRRNKHGQLPVATGPYETWLRQTLRVRLDNARIGALSSDTALYTTSLETTTDLIEEFFAEGTARNDVLSRLAQLESIPLATEPPQIGAALKALESARRDSSLP